MTVEINGDDINLNNVTNITGIKDYENGISSFIALTSANTFFHFRSPIFETDKVTLGSTIYLFPDRDELLKARNKIISALNKK
jgi:hypothetical protein